MNRIKLALIAGGALLATPAFADEPAPPTETPAGAEVPTGEAGGTMDPAATTTGVTVATPNWPQAAIDRPYVIPASKIAAGGNLGVATVTFTNPITMMSESSTGELMSLLGAYGVTDQITAGITYAFALNEFEIKGPLKLFGEYSITHSSKMSITASADFELDLCGSADVDGCVATKAIHAGLGARYNVAPKMGVFTGAPFGPGPVGQHLTISLETDGPIDFGIPVGFAYQATPQLMAYASTHLATIHFNPPDMGESVTFIGDSVPLTLGGLFALNKNIDVHGALSLDFAGIADAWGLTLGATWYN